MIFKKGDEVLITTINRQGFEFNNEKCTIQSEPMNGLFHKNNIQYKISTWDGLTYTITAKWYEIELAFQTLPEELFKI
jgi:hypothetical protein